MLVRRARPAMATLFEAWLVGDDEEHLGAVAEAALDEVARIERLLSRHDPAAEVARINREAAGRPVRVDPELFSILLDCRAWCERTGGYFDVCASASAQRPGSGPRFGAAVHLDEDRRTVAFGDASAALDLGGFGKGYALDAALRIVEAFGVRSALLHGGTSSILVRGGAEGGAAWQIGIRDPFAGEGGAEAARLDLSDCGLSSSAALAGLATESDLVDPVSGRALDRQAGCTALAPSAAEAEVLSTALLAMGRERARGFLEEQQARSPGWRAAWIGRRGQHTVVEWLVRPPP